MKTTNNFKAKISICLIIIIIFSINVLAVDIRVLLKSSGSSQVITSNKGMIIYDLSLKKGVEVIPFRKAKIYRNDDRIEVFVNEKTYREKGLLFKPLNHGNLHFNKKYYRGNMMIIPDPKNNRFMVINVLDIESYLKGVVAEEIPHTWHIECIKAQAVAARTYAYEKILNNKPDTFFDVVATDMSQVYGGMESERESSTKAVEETKGIILTYHNRPIAAFFHSTCGGSTDDAEHVWGKSFPYLKHRTCYYCKSSPHYKWKYTLSTDKLEQIMRNKGYNTGHIRYLKMIGKTDGGRFKKIEIKGTENTVRLTSNQFRIMVGAKYLKSTRFSAKIYSDKIFFTGGGFGHGIGMCQWGAKGMAERGYTYKKILFHYYSNVKLKKIKN